MQGGVTVLCLQNIEELMVGSTGAHAYRYFGSLIDLGIWQ